MIFLNPLSTRSDYTSILILFFSDSRSVSPILGFQLNSFSEYPRFNSFIFARYYLDYDSDFASDFRLVSALSILRFDSLSL